MKQQLTRIAPLQCGTVFGVLYGIMALIFVILFGTAIAIVGDRNGPPVPLRGVFLVLLPVGYALAAFIGGVILAALYNVVAKWTGGFEFEVRDVSSPIQYTAVGSVKVSTRPPDES